MESNDIESLRAKFLDDAYWPWPIAFAYCQTADIRMASVDAAIEALETYPRENMGFARGLGAVARAYEVATGRSYQAHPVEGVDADGEPYTIKSGPEVYWEEVSEIELPLVGAIKAGQLDTWGRATPQAKLDKLDATDWVGCEVDPAETCDLVKDGWRVKASDLSAIFGEIERHTIAYDIHLLGAAVRQLVEAYDRRMSDGDGPIFNDYEKSDRALREGYWSLFVAGAWIATKEDRFVAAVQEYEVQSHLKRGGCHSGGGWLFLDRLMAERFDITLSDAVKKLREKLECGRLGGGVGREINSKSRPIERHEWKDWAIAHDNHGMAVLPGVYDLAWPSDAVRAAFPPVPAGKTTKAHKMASFDDIHKRCDDLWLEGKGVREMDQIIPKEPTFAGVKSETIRTLTHGRYPRVGRGKRHPDMIRR